VAHRPARARDRQRPAARLPGGTPCGTCGFSGRPLHRNVLWPELVSAWELPPDWARWMDAREGSRCAWCGTSLRSGQPSVNFAGWPANAQAGSITCATTCTSFALGSAAMPSTSLRFYSH
jgi:hypothetical protein